MKLMRKAALAFGAAAILLAADLPAMGQQLADKQILRRGNGAEPATLDPHKSEAVPDNNILMDVYEGLVAKGPKGELVPGAAESWTISEDGKTLRFKLRQNAKWSNGDPVTAEDFVNGWRRAVDPATGSKYVFLIYPINKAEEIGKGQAKPDELGVKAVDTHTLEVTLKAPTPYVLGLLTNSIAYPIHKKSLDQHGAQFARAGNLVGNGAFMLKEWTPQSQVVVVKNPHYWDAANVKLTEVYYYPTEDQNAELRRYRAGELDMTNEVPNDQIQWVKQNLPNEFKVGPRLGVYYYGFNIEREPFKDNQKLRQALSMAIDRQTLVEKVTTAGELPAYSWVPPGIEGYAPFEPDWAKWDQAKRNEEAKKLYKEAGYSDQKPLQVEIRYNTNENHKKIAVAIAGMWKQVLGVNATLFNEEFKVFLENRKQKKVTQVFRAGWIGDYEDPNTFHELLLSDAGLNDFGYNNPKYDELVKKAAVTLDVKERMKLLADAEKIMIEDHPAAPIYHYVVKKMVKPYVMNYHVQIQDKNPSRWMAIAKH